MDLLSGEFLSALLAIVIIDLVLAGDNAIVIALAARALPDHLRRKAVLWGTIGAIVVRSAMTLVVVWLLMIPGLRLLGGAALVWIAWKLLVKEEGGEAHAAPAQGFWTAMKTIIVADALMGLDNVLAVAGAAKGSYVLVVLGLLISVPIVVWGSTLILKWVDRFPIIVYVGAGVLAWTAAQMMLHEPLLLELPALAPYVQNTLVQWTIYSLVVAGVLLSGHLAEQRRRSGHIGTARGPESL